MKRPAILALAALLAGCASISDEAKEGLAKDVDCSTAEEDVALLEKERASTTQRALAGASTVDPTSNVVALVGGTWGDDSEVATGEYNKRIEAKIAEIKSTCGLE
ncbi:MAG: hypothetical protein QNJ06_07730 [Kiloniellales bacterium]|nr:hypothetical protein [Kiloniellales bacterium]